MGHTSFVRLNILFPPPLTEASSNVPPPPPTPDNPGDGRSSIGSPTHACDWLGSLLLDPRRKTMFSVFVQLGYFKATQAASGNAAQTLRLGPGVYRGKQAASPSPPTPAPSRSRLMYGTPTASRIWCLLRSRVPSAAMPTGQVTPPPPPHQDQHE